MIIIIYPQENNAILAFIGMLESAVVLGNVSFL